MALHFEMVAFAAPSLAAVLIGGVFDGAAGSLEAGVLVTTRDTDDPRKGDASVLSD